MPRLDPAKLDPTTVGLLMLAAGATSAVVTALLVLVPLPRRRASGTGGESGVQELAGLRTQPSLGVVDRPALGVA